MGDCEKITQLQIEFTVSVVGLESFANYTFFHNVQLSLRDKRDDCDSACVTEAFSRKCSECGFVALVIPHAKRMRHSILPSVVSLAVPYFFDIIS